jgi:hypothetical protein
MLTDPRPALAEQSNFIAYLVGLVGAAKAVRALAADSSRGDAPPGIADDFTFVLLAVAGLGERVEGLANSETAQHVRTAESASPGPSNERFLR